MIIDLLFENRKLIGENILYILKDNGYTKSSFSRLTTISRPTLDKLIKGEVDNLSTFRTHISKILKARIWMLNNFSLYSKTQGKKGFCFCPI